MARLRKVTTKAPAGAFSGAGAEEIQPFLMMNKLSFMPVSDTLFPLDGMPTLLECLETRDPVLMAVSYKNSNGQSVSVIDATAPIQTDGYGRANIPNDAQEINISFRNPDLSDQTFYGSCKVTLTPDLREKLKRDVPTDNVGVTGYKISIDGGVFTDIQNVTIHQFSALSSVTTYQIEVLAYDLAGNESGFELKLKKKNVLTEGKQQLADYLKRLSLDSGWLVIFQRDKVEDVEKLGEREKIEHEGEKIEVIWL